MSDAWLCDSVDGLALSQCQLKLLREEWGLTRLQDLLHVAGFMEQQLHGTPPPGEVLLLEKHVCDEIYTLHFLS